MICGLLERYVVVLFGASPVLNDAGWASGEGELEGGGGSEHALERGWVVCACVCVSAWVNLQAWYTLQWQHSLAMHTQRSLTLVSPRSQA